MARAIRKAQRAEEIRGQKEERETKTANRRLGRKEYKKKKATRKKRLGHREKYDALQEEKTEKERKGNTQKIKR